MSCCSEWVENIELKVMPSKEEEEEKRERGRKNEDTTEAERSWAEGRNRRKKLRNWRRGDER